MPDKPACETCNDTHQVEEPYEELVGAPGSPSGHVGVPRSEMVDCPDCCVKCDQCGRLAHDLEPGYRQLTDHSGVGRWCPADDCLEDWLKNLRLQDAFLSLYTALDVRCEFALHAFERYDKPARKDTWEGLNALVKKLIVKSHQSLWSDEEKEA
ncbi:MAG: hypothetical protein V3V08_05675 [Nannocystaceae bacterium]